MQMETLSMKAKAAASVLSIEQNGAPNSRRGGMNQEDRRHNKPAAD